VEVKYMINKYYNKFSFFLVILLAFIFLTRYSVVHYGGFVNSNFFVALITLVVGVIAICIYVVQKIENKKDAARIIIQGIRRAEEIISDYRETQSYQFAKKIIATNSWNKNIHYFVSDLDNDELDKISELYSTGEYLDYLIKKISDTTLEYEVQLIKDSVPGQATTLKDIGLAWKPRLEVIYSGLVCQNNFGGIKKLILPG